MTMTSLRDRKLLHLFYEIWLIRFNIFCNNILQARLLIRNHYTSIDIIKIFVCANLPNSLLHVAAISHNLSNKMVEEDFIARLGVETVNPFLLRQNLMSGHGWSS